MADQINQGSFRISGRYGEAWRDGRQLFECTGVTAPLVIAQIDVPLAGSDRIGVKDGQWTRTGGQLVMQKVDSRWMNELLKAKKDLATLRALRDAGTPISRTFSLQVHLDDPQALGAEVVEFKGVRLFNYPFGFQTANDLEGTTLDFRWEDEEVLEAFEIQAGPVDPVTGLPKITYTASMTQ